MDHQLQAFRPLAYWKPPKKVARHIRAKSSADFSGALSGGPERHTFALLKEEDRVTDREGQQMSFARMEDPVEMVWENQARGGVNGIPSGPPPAYTVDKEDTLARPWWHVKS